MSIREDELVRYTRQIRMSTSLAVAFTNGSTNGGTAKLFTLRQD